MRFAVLQSNIVSEIIDVDEAFGLWMSWIPTETAIVGDIWDGTTFTSPPPVPPTLYQYRVALDSFLAMKEENRRVALRDSILAAANPPMTTMQEFITALENHPDL